MIFTEVGSLGNYRGIGKYLDIAIDYLLSHPLKDVQAKVTQSQKEQNHMFTFICRFSL